MKIGKFNIPVNSPVASVGGDSVVSNGSTWAALPRGPVNQTFKVDPYTKLLIPFDGNTGDKPNATTGQTLTYVGSAQVSEVQKKFGSASLLLDGDSDYVTVPSSSDWDFGTGDATVDMWVNWSVLPPNSGDLQRIIARAWESPYENGQWGISLINDGGVYKLRFSLAYNGGASWYDVDRTCATTPVVGTWYHIAMVRSGTAVKLFQGGVQCGADITITETMSTVTALKLLVGNTYSAGRSGLFNGYIDEVRVSKGVARWTSAFTPPASAYTAGLVPVWVT